MKSALRRSLLPALLLGIGLSTSAEARLLLREPGIASATPVTDRWFEEESCAFVSVRGDCSGIESLCALCALSSSSATPQLGGGYAQLIGQPGSAVGAEERVGPSADTGAFEVVGRREDPGRARHLRAALEILLLMGAYGVNYYTADRSANSVDWDYDTSASLRARFENGDAYRFDDNTFRINRNHVYAGLCYYQLARSNNLSVAESFVYTFAASSIWEYGVEYREPVSINDQIVTTVGGLALGETLYQIARMLAREPNTLADTILATLFDAPSAFHRWVDGVPAAAGGALRLAPAPGDRTYFDLQATVRLSDAGHSDGSPTALLGVDAGVVNVPNLAAPGTARLWFADTASSRLNLEVPLNNDRASDFSFRAQSTLSAMHYKDLVRTDGGHLQGYTLFLGPGTAFTLLNAALSGHDEHADFMGITHVLGPVLDAAWYLQGTRVRCEVELYGDFAMIRSYAYDDFRNSRTLPEGTSLLDASSYYFGYGYTGSARLSVDRGPFELGAGFRYGSCWSINALPDDPKQPNLNLDVKDDRAVAETWLSYRVSDRLSLRVAVERTERGGSVDGFSPPAATEVRTFATLSYRLR